jgi:hypothetical protein
MFAPQLRRASLQIDVVKAVLATSERIRDVLLRPTFRKDASAELPKKTIVDLVAAVLEAPQRLDWQVYDFCASLTRLYAIFDSFVDEVVSDYLAFLPEVFEQYSQLPERLLRQHRRGVGEILTKLGKDGPYQHLTEGDIIAQLFHGLSGGELYKLLQEAFFTDPRNYRLPVLARLLSSVGIEQAKDRIIKHPQMIQFREKERDDGYTLAAELADFVQRRNEAAHSEIDATVSAELINKFADLIKVLSTVVADILDQEVENIRVARNKSFRVGHVYKTYKKRTVGLINLSAACRLTANDEVLLVRKGTVIRAVAMEIQVDDVSLPVVESSAGRDIGVKFNVQCSELDELHLPRVPLPLPEQMELAGYEIELSTDTSLVEGDLSSPGDLAALDSVNLTDAEILESEIVGSFDTSQPAQLSTESVDVTHSPTESMEDDQDNPA